MRSASSRSNVIVVLSAMVVVVAFAAALLRFSGALTVGETYRVRALVPTAASMGPGASVRMAGIKVGRVVSVERRGVAALLELRLDSGPRPLPRDSRVAVRLRTLVGENYVELFRGRSSSTVASGGLLPISHAEDYVEADKVLSVLKGRARADARRVIQSLGRSVDGRGQQLNGLMREFSGLATTASPLMLTLANDREQVARVVDNLGTVMRAVGERGDAMEALAKNGRIAFEAFAERSEALNETLQALPPTLVRVRRSSQVVREVSRRASPVLTRLAGTVRELRPAIGSLQPASRAGRAAVLELGRAAPAIEELLGDVRRVAPAATSALPAVRKLMCEVNPTLSYIAPYAREIAALITNMSSATNFYDATGHAGRMLALFGEASTTAWNKQALDALDELDRVGMVSKIHMLGYDPYPEPGLAGKPKAGRGVKGPDTAVNKYPRVRAEC